jgi:hypothetical protein
MLATPFAVEGYGCATTSSAEARSMSHFRQLRMLYGSGALKLSSKRRSSARNCPAPAGETSRSGEPVPKLSPQIHVQPVASRKVRRLSSWLKRRDSLGEAEGGLDAGQT